MNNGNSLNHDFSKEYMLYALDPNLRDHLYWYQAEIPAIGKSVVKTDIYYHIAFNLIFTSFWAKTSRLIKYD